VAVTSLDLMKLASIDTKNLDAHKSFSSFLCRMVKTDRAYRYGKSGKHVIYVKRFASLVLSRLEFCFQRPVRVP